MITLEESIPTKNDGYLIAEDVFFIQFNEISFFIEDTEQENFYYNILKKLFPSIQIEKIFPLNGKDNVIEDCKKNIGNKNKIYLVDKDFDDILGRKLNVENLFYLNRYSIENYLLEENSIIEYVICEKPKLKKSYITSKLELDKLINVIKNALKELIHIFILVQKNCPKLKNISLNYERFFDFNNGNFIIKQAQFDSYVDEIINELKSTDGRLKFDAQYKKIQKDFKLDTDEICIVHYLGKFILRMLKQCIESLFGLNSRNIESFSYMIALNSDFNSLEYLKNDITEYIN